MDARRNRTALAAFAVAAVLVTLDMTTACGQCTEPKDASTLKKTIRRATRCNDKILRVGPGVTCTSTPPPACAGTLATDAVKLGYGPNDPPAAEVDHGLMSDQLKCQKRIGRALYHYVGTKMRYLVKGLPVAEGEAKARKHIDKISDDCAVTVAQNAGVVLPAVGPQCAAAVGAPGSTVETTKLRDCLRQLGEVWVDRYGPTPQPLRPNILFILSDDQRWDTTDGTHLSTCNGGANDGLVCGGAGNCPGGACTPTDVMPGLRHELGGSGIEFTSAFMGTPLCCPSRSSILRGQYAHHTGVYTNTGTHGGADDFVPNEPETVGTLLQAAGYRTGFIGKYMNGYNGLWPDNMTPYVPVGWTVWGAFRNVGYFNYGLIEGGVVVQHGNAEADYSTDVLRERAKEFITDSVALGQPFFLHLSFKTPHGPWEPAPRHVGKFAGLPLWRPASHNEADVSDKPTWVQNTPPLTSAQVADIDDIRIAQLEMLQSLDEAIAGSTQYGITGIMQHLRNLGIADNTIVVYFSDNGWHWGEHRYKAKNKPYEESIRAPMFIRYPKLAPLPRVEGSFALNIDFCPTFVDLALRSTDPQPTITFDGTSLVRLVDGTAPIWRTDFMTEGWPGNHVWATVREQRWKYSELPTTPGDPATTFERELYDLETDPLELINVAADPANATRIATMAARLRQIRPTWPGDSDSTIEDENEE